ncbi:hypothetical protein E2542_SST08847 [Spatholobus suberectus]|nr:hypothetical protein E2542_SST08847 [Spatholobus suberectus]
MGVWSGRGLHDSGEKRRHIVTSGRAMAKRQRGRQGKGGRRVRWLRRRDGLISGGGAMAVCPTEGEVTQCDGFTD